MHFAGQLRLLQCGHSAARVAFKHAACVLIGKVANSLLLPHAMLCYMLSQTVEESCTSLSAGILLQVRLKPLGEHGILCFVCTTIIGLSSRLGPTYEENSQAYSHCGPQGAHGLWELSVNKMYHADLVEDLLEALVAQLACPDLQVCFPTSPH